MPQAAGICCKLSELPPRFLSRVQLVIQSRDLSETLVLSESLSLLFYLLNFKAAMSAVCLLYVMGSYAMTGVGTPPPDRSTYPAAVL